MFYFHGGCLAGGENDALGYMVDMDPHGNALGQTHPGEDRVDLRESLRAGLRIGDVDAPCDAVDPAPYAVSLTNTLDLRRIAPSHRAQPPLLELATAPP